MISTPSFQPNRGTHPLAHPPKKHSGISWEAFSFFLFLLAASKHIYFDANLIFYHMLIFSGILKAFLCGPLLQEYFYRLHGNSIPILGFKVRKK
jgi:hypothetical protein